MTTTGSVGVERLELGDELEALAAGRRVARVVQVEQHRVEVARCERREHRRRRAGRLDLVALALEQQAERLEDVGLIVGDEDVGGGRWVRHGAWVVESGGNLTRVAIG